jgi:hypothetical protein
LKFTRAAETLSPTTPIRNIIFKLVKWGHNFWPCYCPLTWHFCTEQNSNKIEKIQERALRFIYNDSDSSYETLLQNSIMNNNSVVNGYDYLTNSFPKETPPLDPFSSC